MSHHRVIYETDDKTWRILEHIDHDADFDDLCGDTYNPDVNPDIPREQLLAELEQFRDLVNREGVFGYVLEHWNPAPGRGYDHIDSCWGFVGAYSPGIFNHYIVEELKGQIKESDR